jgi:hypothetical protein
VRSAGSATLAVSRGRRLTPPHVGAVERGRDVELARAKKVEDRRKVRRVAVDKEEALVVGHSLWWACCEGEHVRVPRSARTC